MDTLSPEKFFELGNAAAAHAAALARAAEQAREPQAPGSASRAR